MENSLPDSIEFAKKQISEAFLNSQYPGDNNLVYDNNCMHDECLTIKKIFTGKKWEKITLRDLQQLYFSFFTFCSIQAYHYYLPAFMVISLENYSEFDSKVMDMVLLDGLIPPSKDCKPRKKWQYDIVDGFTERQKKAITTFLECIVDYYKNKSDWAEYAEIAIKNVWNIHSM
jgi:hypothetical protein